MYRPPHTATVQLTSFIDYFTDRLSLLNVRETTVVCGDFNINLLSINSNEHYNTFFADTLSSSFLPTITLPTRLSNNSSLIDNIFVNKHERLNFAGILRLAPMWQQSGTLLFCSCHGIAGFLVDELQI